MKLKPAFHWKQARHLLDDRLKMAVRFRLKLDMTCEGLDPRMFERKTLEPDGADKLDRADAMRFFGKDKIVTRRTHASFNFAQDSVAGLSLV